MREEGSQQSGASAPLVSVIVRAYNRKRYLEEALCSIRLQSVPCEAIIIQDGSEELGANFTDCLGEVPFQHIVLGKVRGRVFSANHGLSLARGKYICFLDDDDIFYPYHLSTLVEALAENPNYKAAYSDALKAVQKPWCGFYSTSDLVLDHSKDYNYSELRQDNFIPILCCLFDKSILSGGIQMDNRIEVLEDWDLWLQIAKRNPFLHIREITCEYRVRTDKSNTTGQVNHLWSYSKKFIADKHNLSAEALA